MNSFYFIVAIYDPPSLSMLHAYSYSPIGVLEGLVESGGKTDAKNYLRDECGESNTDRCTAFISPMALDVLLACLHNVQLSVFWPVYQARLEAKRWSL